jgi:hypothetical protein
MKEPTFFERFLRRVTELFSRANCTRGRHRWGYSLAESGKIYLDNAEVPKELWYCLKCHVRKHPKI